MEFILKIVAKGLILMQESYFLNIYNILDFLCLIGLILDLLYSSN